MRTAIFDPGRLRHELVLESPARVADALGGYSETWTAVVAVWGRLEPVRAAPAERAGAEEPDITHRIIVRADPRIAAGQRLRTDDRIFSIRTVRDPDETGRYLECLTREGTP